MSYIGNTPGDKYLTLEKQTFTTSATDTYNLNREVSSVNDIELFLNNVRQEPTEAYTISGTTLTLASAITASDSMYCIYQGRSVGTQAPATGSVTNAMLAGSIANDKLAGGIESSKLAFASYPYRNLIINGDMSIAQRGTSFTVSDNIYTLDRYLTEFGGFGGFTLSQSTDAPEGFGYSLKLDCTTADASPASGDVFQLFHRIEGQNLQHLKKGTSSAQSLSLSFWVKSNKTGNMQVNLRDAPNNRIIGGVYTINTANTWENKTLTFTGDTSGTIDNDNTEGLSLEFPIGSGSNYSSGAVPTSWETKVDADRNAGSNINLADSTSNYINITGVQLEVGTSASDFEFLPYDVNFQRCQRYFQVFRNAGTMIGMCNGTTDVAHITPQVTEMLRASPTIYCSGGFVAKFGSSAKASASTGPSNITFTAGKIGWNFVIGGFTALTDNAPAALRTESDMTIDAEL